MSNLRLSATRVALLRVVYAIIVLGNAVMIAPTILFPATSLADSHTVISSMLGALMLVSAIGLLQPVKMLPVLLWEAAWKSIWFFNFALRMWLDGGLDEYAAGVLVGVLGNLLVVAFIPWGFVYRYYLKRTPESWTRGVDLGAEAGNEQR